jgi:hypothetical protein
MVISTEGTCDYVFEIGGDLQNGGAVSGRLRDRVGAGEKRLVGHTPRLTSVEYQREEWQLYARVTLTATDREHAMVGEASFSRGSAVHPHAARRDMLYMSRTSCGGVGCR